MSGVVGGSHVFVKGPRGGGGALVLGSAVPGRGYTLMPMIGEIEILGSEPVSRKTPRVAQGTVRPTVIGFDRLVDNVPGCGSARLAAGTGCIECGRDTAPLLARLSAIFVGGQVEKKKPVWKVSGSTTEIVDWGQLRTRELLAAAEGGGG